MPISIAILTHHLLITWNVTKVELIPYESIVYVWVERIEGNDYIKILLISKEEIILPFALIVPVYADAQTLAAALILAIYTGTLIDHGHLAGLADNDHVQYVNAVSDTASLDLTLAGQSISGVVLAAGVDHGLLAGLGDDDHIQYALLAGRAGGQTLIGGTLTTQNLTLRANAADLTTGSINISTTTVSTTITTGALVVAGGVGISKALFVGENINIPSTYAYTQNSINLIRVPALSSTSLCIGNSGNQTFTGVNNFCAGSDAGLNLTIGTCNIFIGDNSGRSKTNSGGCIAIGYEAAYNGAIIGGLTAVGHQAMRYHTGGNGNTCIGYQAGLGTPAGCIYVYNTFIGELSGGLCHQGNYNTCLGKNSAYNLNDGCSNVFLGYCAGYRQVNNSNLLIIDNQDRTTVALEATNSLIYGTFAATVTGQNLTVNGYLNIPSGVAYRQNSINLIRIPAASVTSICIGNSGNQTFTGTNCLLMGDFETGASLTSGIQNILIANGAGKALTTQNYNILIGYQAGYKMADASGEQVGIGTLALYNNTTGIRNFALGTCALYTNISGNYNVALGAYALYTLNSNNNIGIGYQAGYYQTGANGCFIGFQAGKGVAGSSGVANLAIGTNSGYALTTGGYNIAIGDSAGRAITTGIENTFIGYNTGRYTTTTNQNTAIGACAGWANTGSYNTYISAYAGYFNIAGISNIAIGYGAGMGVFTVSGYSQCQLIGHYAGNLLTSGQYDICIGSSSGMNLSSGNRNLLLGFESGKALTVENYNLFFGYHSGLLSTGSSNIFIGYNSGCRQTTNSNLLIIDNQDRTSAALELTNSLIYGTFAAAVANQWLRINGAIRCSGLKTGTLAVPPAGLVQYELWADITDDAAYPKIRMMA